MTSDNSKSQIDFLDLKIIKIKIQALLLLRFNLRFKIWDFTIRQSSLSINCQISGNLLFWLAETTYVPTYSYILDFHLAQFFWTFYLMKQSSQLMHELCFTK